MASRKTAAPRTPSPTPGSKPLPRPPDGSLHQPGCIGSSLMCTAWGVRGIVCLPLQPPPCATRSVVGSSSSARNLLPFCPCASCGLCPAPPSPRVLVCLDREMNMQHVGAGQLCGSGRRWWGNRRRLWGNRRRLWGNRRRLWGNRRRLWGNRRRLWGNRRRLWGNRRRLWGVCGVPGAAGRLSDEQTATVLTAGIRLCLSLPARWPIPDGAVFRLVAATHPAVRTVRVHTLLMNQSISIRGRHI